MRTNLGYADLMRALRLLDRALGILGHDEVEIRATGGFALMAHGLRTGGYTADIDTVTPSFDGAVERAIEAVSIKLDLEPDWLNNEAVFSYDDRVTQDDVDAYDALLSSRYVELATSFRRLRVKVADLETLARSKAIACSDIGRGRSAKDLRDLAETLEAMGYGSAGEAARDLRWLGEPEFAPVVRAVDRLRVDGASGLEEALEECSAGIGLDELEADLGGAGRERGAVGRGRDGGDGRSME